VARGAFGRVYKAKSKRDGATVALKTVDLAGLKRHERAEAVDEARTLSRLAHPNIVRHLDSFIDGDTLGIVMEWLPGGTAHALARAGLQGGPGGRGGRADEVAAWRIFLGALSGLVHLHSKRVIHRDVKSMNLFLDGEGHARVGDLGIARQRVTHRGGSSGGDGAARAGPC